MTNIGQLKIVVFCCSGRDYVDLGAQWVNGEIGNVVFEMASPNNLIVKDIYDRVYIEPSGNVINRADGDKLTQILEDVVDSVRLLNYTGSVGDYFDQEYPKKMIRSPLRDSPLSMEIYDWFAKELTVDDGSDSWYETSGRGYAIYDMLDGHQEWGWTSGGYHTVFDLLMKKIPNPENDLHILDKIYLNSEVVEIVWDNLHPDLENKVLIKCRNGVTFVADHVLVTVSLGVLKATAQRMFKPVLPPQNWKTIQGLGYGTVDKIILEFPYKWWPNTSNEFALVWEPNDLCKSKILTNNKTNMDECWDHFVYAFNGMHNQPNVLCGWIYGAAARYMEELSEFEVKNKVVALLQKFVGKALNTSVPSPSYFLR
ncbi:hypothetical protein C0J52_21842 [Blattella germanica]|nr:hypothetical protein C0J52_21842 [Blattella germanica]